MRPLVNGDTTLYLAEKTFTTCFVTVALSTSTSFLPPAHSYCATMLLLRSSDFCVVVQFKASVLLLKYSEICPNKLTENY